MVKYITGVDLFSVLPEDKNVIIAHIVNTHGVAGAGFVVPLKENFPIAINSYFEWAKDKFYNNIPFELGQTQFVGVKNNIIVANLLAQELGWKNGIPPIRYNALKQCMETVQQFISKRNNNVEIHSPRFGCGLSGGDPKIIDGMINEIWKDLNVTIYSF